MDKKCKDCTLDSFDYICINCNKNICFNCTYKKKSSKILKCKVCYRCIICDICIKYYKEHLKSYCIICNQYICNTCIRVTNMCFFHKRCVCGNNLFFKCKVCNKLHCQKCDGFSIDFKKCEKCKNIICQICIINNICIICKDK